MPVNIAPNVVGMTHLEAEMTLDAAGFVGTGAIDIPTCSDTVPAGHVIEQDPAAGTWVPYGLQGVILKISGALVPDVVGLNEAGAESSLNNWNLIKGTITYDCGESFVPSGIVIAQSEEAYTYVPCGSAVNLIISGAIVPDVLVMTEAQAETSLNAAGLVKGSVTFAYSDVIPAGHVVSQSPDPGTIVECGSVVDLVIAKEKEDCVVPDVLGMTEVQAEAALNAAGLIKGSVTHAYSDTVVAGTVMAQEPAAGTLLACGSLVDLVISLGSSGGGGGMPIQLDIKPNNCANRITIPIKAADKIRIPVAIIGSSAIDVSEVDRTSLLLEGVPSLTESVVDKCSGICDVPGPDGFYDLMLTFRAADVIEAIGGVNNGETVTLKLTGELERDGEVYSFEIEDFATFVFKGPGIK